MKKGGRRPADYRYSYLQEMCIRRDVVFAAKNDDMAIKKASQIKREALTHIGTITDEAIWRGRRTRNGFVPKSFLTFSIP